LFVLVFCAQGKNREIECETADRFRQRLEEYADSSDTSQGMAFWPIVKVINAFGPWNILRGGLTIMDVPGVADDNAARNAVVKRVLKEADLILIVSRIQRAVNDRAARTLLNGKGGGHTLSVPVCHSLSR
jgi:hypothetical protein